MMYYIQKVSAYYNVSIEFGSLVVIAFLFFFFVNTLGNLSLPSILPIHFLNVRFEF